MAKGLFSQGIAVLYRQLPTLAELRAQLEPEFSVAREVPADGEHWEMGGDSLVIPYRREVNGAVSVDLVSRPWPDHMGDPKAEPMLFGAWSMGHFGPFAYPGGLARAAQQAWGWAGAKDAVAAHHAFARIRLSYIFGAPEDAKVLPADCDPVDELRFVNRIAEALLGDSRALCLFNPNGEVLLDAARLRDRLEFAEKNALPPLDVWTNVRLTRFDPDWLMMDTVGNWQFDLPDMQAAFPAAAQEPGPIDPFLRNMTLYLLTNGPVIKDGNTTDGPGEIRWLARELEDPLIDPPRDVLRWFPRNATDVPVQLFPPRKETPKKDPPKKAWWKFGR